MPAGAFWDDTRQGILGRCPPGLFGTIPARAFRDDARQGLLGRYPPGNFGTMPARAFWHDARQGLLERYPPWPLERSRQGSDDNRQGLVGRSPAGLFGTMPARAFLDGTRQGYLGRCPPWPFGRSSRATVCSLPSKPARASAFIGVSILLDADALTGIAVPARVSTFNSAQQVLSTDTCQARMPLRASRSPQGLRRPIVEIH